VVSPANRIVVVAAQLTSANARLIAAAPEMAALLQEYAKRSADVVDPSAASLIARTRAVLAKVEP